VKIHLVQIIYLIISNSVINSFDMVSIEIIS